MNYVNDYSDNCLITEISYKVKNQKGTQYYSRYLKFSDVSNLSEERLEKINTCVQNLVNGEEPNLIAKELIDVLKSNILVVWNEKQLVLLTELMKQYGYASSKIRYIVLRNNVSSVCGNNYNMFTCLRMMHVVFEELQIDTLYSVMCLEHLFKLVFRFYYSATKSYDGALYSMVKRKQLRVNRRAIPQTYVQSKFNEGPLEGLLSLYGLEYQVGIGVVFIKSKYSKWRILCDGEFIYGLQHKSMQIASIYKGSQNKFGDEYHQQSVVCRSLHDVVQYIVNHDKNYLSKRRLNTHSRKNVRTPGQMNIFDL